MANMTLIIGEPGTGKSTSIRMLDPTKTFIISVLNKPLPLKGYKRFYKKINEDCTEGNYYSSFDSYTLVRLIKKISMFRPDIKVLIVDDFQYLMSNEFMEKALEKGYNKFSEIAQHTWNVIKELDNVRDDLNCYVISHSHTDDRGISKCKTIGKLLDEKISIEGLFTTVFHSLIIENKYLFLTQHDGEHIAKSPLGMFEHRLIDNDLLVVNNAITEYFEYLQEDVNQ